MFSRSAVAFVSRMLSFPSDGYVSLISESSIKMLLPDLTSTVASWPLAPSIKLREGMAKTYNWIEREMLAAKPLVGAAK